MAPMPRKPKNELAKSPKRDHIGYDPAYTARLNKIMDYYKTQDKSFSKNMLIQMWIRAEEKKLGWK